MKYVYMNHRIREKKPSGPVIVCQTERDDVSLSEEGNAFAIYYKGERLGSVIFEPKGLPQCETHDVKAWVEFHDAVDVLRMDTDEARGLPKASAKLPNAKVKF